MPASYPREFHADVAAVARRREPGVTLKQTAEDFGIAASLTSWLKQSDIENGKRPGMAEAETVENRELRKRLRILERENEVLRRAGSYLSQANLNLGGSPKVIYQLVDELAGAGIPRDGDVPGSQHCSAAVLSVEATPGDRRSQGGQAHRVNALVGAHREVPEFGYRYLANEVRKAGWGMSRRTA